MTAAPLSIVVVDDHHVYRLGLVHALRARGLDVIADATSGPEAVETILRTRPTVALMDLGLPGFDGVEAIRRIRDAGTDTQILALTVHADREQVVVALIAGAAGYLLKDSSVDEIAAAITGVTHGEAPMSARVLREIVGHLRVTEVRRPAPLPPGARPALTARERDVLALMAEGCSNATISERLVISSHTAKSHVSSVITKLGVNNRVEAIVRTYRDGLLEPPSAVGGPG